MPKLSPISFWPTNVIIMNETNFTSASENIALTFGVINIIFEIFGLLLNILIFSIFIAGKNTHFKHKAYFWMIFLVAVRCLVLGIYIGVDLVMQSNLGPVVSSSMIWFIVRLKIPWSIMTFFWYWSIIDYLLSIFHSSFTNN